MLKAFEVQLVNHIHPAPSLFLVKKIITYCQKWSTKSKFRHMYSEALYSQLLPCGHLSIKDTPIIQTATKSPPKIADVWLKWFPAITVFRYLGH